MTDAELFTGDDFFLDINFVNGGLQLLKKPVAKNTATQRKQVLAYQIVATIPGDWERGVQWTKVLSDPNVSIAEMMSQVQVALDDDEGVSASNSFTIPIIQSAPTGGNGQINLQLLTVSGDDLEGYVHGGT